MEINIAERGTFYVCGYSIATTLSQNDKDVSALFKDFISKGKDTILYSLEGSKKGYYGLSWYTWGHERYCYLLGIEAGQNNIPPQNAIIKEVPKTTYAMARFLKGENIINAWNEFFYNEIPRAGFAVNGEHNIYFEYYPGNVDEEFELWVPVVKADV